MPENPETMVRAEIMIILTKPAPMGLNCPVSASIGRDHFSRPR